MVPALCRSTAKLLMVVGSSAKILFRLFSKSTYAQDSFCSLFSRALFCPSHFQADMRFPETFQKLCHMGKARAAIIFPGPRTDQLSDSFRNRVCWFPIPVSVGQGSNILPCNSCLQPKDLPLAHLEPGCSLRRRHFPPYHPVHNHRFFRFLDAQENISPHSTILTWGVTFSLSRHTKML